MNSYELSRNWFDWCFANPEKSNTNHHAIYFFAIEHCNRLGWKDKFGFPSQMVMEAIGIKNWRTYSKALNDLVAWGFIKMVETSKNQYSANVIAIVKNTKAQSKALDKALQKHSTKHSQSIVSIDKQLNKEPNNNKSIDERKLKFADTLKPFVDTYGREMIREFYDYWSEPNQSNTKFRKELQRTWSLDGRLRSWAKNDKKFKPKDNGSKQQELSIITSEFRRIDPSI